MFQIGAAAEWDRIETTEATATIGASRAPKAGTAKTFANRATPVTNLKCQAMSGAVAAVAAADAAKATQTPLTNLLKAEEEPKFRRSAGISRGTIITIPATAAIES